MKKFVSLAAACVLFLHGWSQKSRVAITAGFAQTNITKTLSGINMNGDYCSGLITGLQLEAPVCKRWSFQPDLNYIAKGDFQRLPSNTTNKRVHVVLHYAELFPNMVYNWKSKKENVFYIGAGPFIAANLPSKIVTTPLSGTNVTSDVTFGNQVSNDFRGIDWGVNGVIGFRISSGFFISVNWIQSSRNITTTTASGDKQKNTGFAFRLGYLFKNKEGKEKGKK